MSPRAGRAADLVGPARVPQRALAVAASDEQLVPGVRAVAGLAGGRRLRAERRDGVPDQLA